MKNPTVQERLVFDRLLAGEKQADALLRFFDRLDDVVEVRPVAGVEFGMEEFAIGVDLESAAARGNQRERFDALAELKNLGRQTDGLRRVVSNDAVFDRYLGFHRQSPFQNETIGAMKSGQEVVCSIDQGMNARLTPIASNEEV